MYSSAHAFIRIKKKKIIKMILKVIFTIILISIRNVDSDTTKGLFHFFTLISKLCKKNFDF